VVVHGGRSAYALSVAYCDRQLLVGVNRLTVWRADVGKWASVVALPSVAALMGATASVAPRWPRRYDAWLMMDW
jgi:hypothetical protein